jgi:uncharacterized protein YbjT (DUF2867 family)
MIAGGSPVRVMSREAARAEPLRALGAHPVVADLRDPETLGAAVTGATTVIAAAHGFAGTDAAGADAIDRRGNAALLAASARAGVRHVVLVSVYGASVDSAMPLCRAKHDAEEGLRGSGLDWTIVQPTSFMETWLGLVGDPLANGGRAMVFGRGQNPINFVSAHDVAEVVVDAAIDGRGRGTVAVTGPANITFDAFAAVAHRASGGDGDPALRHVPRALLRTMSTALRPVRPVIADQIRAALVMDTLDMTAPIDAGRTRLEDVASERYAARQPA